MAAELHALGHDVVGVAADPALIAAGLVLEHRFATWDLRPWREDAEFGVTVVRRPA